MRKLSFICSKGLVLLLLFIFITTSVGIDIIALDIGDEMPAEMTIDDEVDGNSPLLKSSESSEEDPIENVGWYFSNSGVVNSLYFNYFRIEARFSSSEDIESIEYTYSSDGTVWESFKIYSDYGISMSGDHWYRQVYVDMTDVADGTYTVRAVASTAEHSLTSEQTIIKDTIAPVVSDLTVEPNEKNSGLVLTWTNPDSDFEYVEIYRWEVGGGYDFFSAETEDIESNGGESASSKEVGIMSSWDWDSPDGSEGYWRYIDKTHRHWASVLCNGYEGVVSIKRIM